MSNRDGISPHFEEVQVGDKLPRRLLGPHSIASFTTEYRAFLFNIWGTFHWVGPAEVEDPWIYQDAGWIDSFGFDEERAKVDPRQRDGLYVGPSRGHIDNAKAGEIGMSRAYGYGATMAAWNTDYLAYWAGNDGFVRHTKSDFRGPAFEGDVTYFDGEVVGKEENSAWGVPIVQVKVKLTDQDGKTVITSTNEVELPLLSVDGSRPVMTDMDAATASSTAPAIIKGIPLARSPNWERSPFRASCGTWPSATRRARRW